MNVVDCLKQGFLQKTKIDKEIIDKELKESSYDLEKAQKAFQDKDFKWAIVKSYYSVFHSSRALLNKLGLREKKHFAISVILEELNKQGRLEIKYVNDFNAALYSREEADYYYNYSKESAEHNLEIAEQFIEKMKELTNSKVGLKL